MQLGLSRVHFPITSLGPGQRLGIWFQGCSLRCQGCIAVDTWAPSKQKVSIKHLLQRIAPWLAQAQGISISGGEPFEQFDALKHLLQQLKQQAPALDILLFSGWRSAQLEPLLPELAGLVDALISEPFEQQQKQTLALRGSDNQQLHLLTELGTTRFASYQRLRTAQDKKLDVMMDENGQMWLAGIPERDDLLRLQQQLAQRGQLITSTLDRRSN